STALGGRLPVLSFIDAAGNPQVVQTSQLAPGSFRIDTQAGTITIVFDGSSFPRLSSLNRTVFTISIPTTVEVIHPVTPAPDSALALALAMSVTTLESVGGGAAAPASAGGGAGAPAFLAVALGVAPGLGVNGGGNEAAGAGAPP